jgi:PAS domain S-box-containing protein
VNPRFCQPGYARDEAIGRRRESSSPAASAMRYRICGTIAGQPWQGACATARRTATYWEDAIILGARRQRPISHYVAVGEDITDKLAAEERLARGQRYSSSHDGILITDPAGFVVDVNTAFERITGYSRSELVGNKASMLNSGQHDSFFFSHMWETIAREGIWRGEITNRRKDGSLLVEVLTISAVRDDEGQVSHYVGAFTDITELKSQERLAFRPPRRFTGLPNRSLLTDRLSQALGGAAPTRCWPWPTPGFTPINESFGHQAGDRCRWKWRAGLPRPCAASIPWRASVATSSSCCC